MPVTASRLATSTFAINAERLDRIGNFDSQNRPFGFYYCRISLAGPLLGDFCNNIGHQRKSSHAEI